MSAITVAKSPFSAEPAAPAALLEAGQAVEQAAERRLHVAKEAVDALGALGASDEGLVVGKGQVARLLQQLRSLFRQALGLAPQPLQPGAAQLPEVAAHVGPLPPLGLGEAVSEQRCQEPFILHLPESRCSDRRRGRGRG